MCFKLEGAISTLKFVERFTYFGSNISSSESDANIHLVKAWNAINRLLIIWNFDLSDKIKLDFFPAVDTPDEC